MKQQFQPLNHHSEENARAIVLRKRATTAVMVVLMVAIAILIGR